ncbi:MAG: methionyl-tRNA formyltransferase [Planctomycetota bacterium]|nr:MAG: methionyl-tRNA formyltransferase [Planctomycetota bacterium]
MKTVFLGSPPFALEPFRALLQSGHPPAALITAPPRRSGRGRKTAQNPLVKLAEAHGLPILQPVSAKDEAFLQAWRDLEPDLGVVVAYGQILSPQFLAVPTWGCINLHASLLPRWRGASPIQAALISGDSQTGVCLQKVVPALDAGAVLASASLSLAQGPADSPEQAWTSPRLASALAEMGASLLVDFLEKTQDGPLPAGQEQDPEQVTLCRRLRKEDGWLHWGRSSEEVDRQVRALLGWPDAQTALPDGTALKILEGKPCFGEHAAAPGEVLSTQAGLEIACGGGSYQVFRLQRAGKAPMDAEAFLRGHSLPPGSRLQSPGEAQITFLSPSNKKIWKA